MIVLWTANTERFCDVAKGLNDTAENLLRSINSNEEEVSPSTIFAVASVLEGVSVHVVPDEGSLNEWINEHWLGSQLLIDQHLQ